MKQAMCSLCTYAAWLAGRFPGILLCFNHPDSPGQVREVGARGCCRNFRAHVEPALRLPAPAPPNPRVRLIPLTRGQFAMVDVEDFAWLSRYRWFAMRRNGGGYYAITKRGPRSISMHRLIMGEPQGLVVDHIDGNGLNNCRCNLRICTRQQNNCNRKAKPGASAFIGVHKRRGRWHARVVNKGEQTNSGLFDSEIEAALARDLIALQVHGPYAHFNFPGIMHAIREARARREGSDKGQGISEKPQRARQRKNGKSKPGKKKASERAGVANNKSEPPAQEATNDPALARARAVREALARAHEPATSPAPRKRRKKAG